MKLFSLRFRRHGLSGSRFIVLLLALCAFPLAAAEVEPDIRLEWKVVPTFQAVSLELDADQADYRGSVRVELRVEKPTSRFLFHAEGQTFDRLALRGARGEVEAEHRRLGDDVVEVRTGEPLARGEYTLEIDFHRPFGTQAVGLYRTDYEGSGYAFTQFEADDAREAFPVWDEPAFKFPYQLTLSVPEGHMAITNTPVAKQTVADGWKTIEFQKTKPLPSYLLAIATGPLETVDIPGLGVPARIVTAKGQSHLTRLAIEATPPLLKALEAYFGTPYPYEKLDFIAVPEFWPGGMENPGAITYSDGILLLDPETASVNQRVTQARVIAHELAHQWFGNLVTMQWWDDLWLNEAFANWMGNKMTAQVFPEFQFDIGEAESNQNILELDARSTTQPIRKPVTSAADLLQGLGLTYQKGTAVFVMFEQWLGEENFRKGINAYLEANAWGNATAADLWKALDASSDKGLTSAMATFIDQPGFPLIEVESLGDGRVRLRQQRFRNAGVSSPDHLWKVPVGLAFPGPDGIVHQVVLLEEESAVVRLDLPEGSAEPAWIFPNAAANGYYHWSVSEEQLQTLADVAAEAFEARERIAFLGNVSSLLDAGRIGGGAYLRLLSRLADDPSPQVVSAAISELGGVKMAFVPAELTDEFALYVRQTLGPVLRRIGTEGVSGEDPTVSLMRPRLMTWLGRDGRDPEIVDRARALADRFLKTPDGMDPALAEVALELAAADGDLELFETFRKRFESAETPTERSLFLGALGSFGDPELQKKALNYSLEGPVRPNEIFSIGGGLTSSPEGRDDLYRFMTDNFDRVMQRIPPMFASFLPMVASGCSLERLEHAEEFFRKPEHSAPGTDKTLAQVGEQVEDCVRLRQREGGSVAEFLSEVAATAGP